MDVKKHVTDEQQLNYLSEKFFETGEYKTRKELEDENNA